MYWLLREKGFQSSAAAGAATAAPRAAADRMRMTAFLEGYPQGFAMMIATMSHNPGPQFNHGAVRRPLSAFRVAI